MRKFIFIFLIIFLVIGSIIIYYPYFVQNSVYKAWDKNFNFNIPVNKTQTIFKIAGNNSYTISDYTDGKKFEEVKNNSTWTLVDVYQDALEHRVLSYQNQIEQMDPTTSDFYKKKIEAYPIIISKDSLYFENKKDDGSYIIAILNIQDKRLYVLELFF